MLTEQELQELLSTLEYGYGEGFMRLPIARKLKLMSDTFGDESDKVNNPAHYNSSPAKCDCGRRIECIDVVKFYSFSLGNVIKYVWRAGLKKSSTELEDLKKARWYLDSRIDQLSPKPVGNCVDKVVD